jgi:hypothetical protein
MNPRVNVENDWSSIHTMGSINKGDDALVGVVRCYACGKAMEITGAALSFGAVLTIKGRCLTCNPLAEGEELSRPKSKRGDGY